MIKYKLSCKSCKISFDSWFASSKEYDKLKKKNLLNCHICNSRKVEKSLMAPKLINKPISKSFDNQNLKLKKISNKIKEYQKFIKNNFEFVGKNFAYEARSIHYNSKKNIKGIYGTATKEEIKELKEEGVKTEIIPWLEDKSN
ncbi:DUF1178 family protein [Pelagibacterales bacterium SAG-MED37]|nr:DUF1178 family protein [Pelagibacterales bacterium SAG-MED37]